MVHYVGIDATVFLRFTRMCRDVSIVLSVLGCAILVPIHIKYVDEDTKPEQWLLRMTPSNVFGKAIWAQVVVAYLFNITCAGFLWWNYRKVLGLRRKYFASPEYQNSLHSRTLMVSLLRTLPVCLDQCLLTRLVRSSPTFQETSALTRESRGL